ncbi:class I SAM-dependent DNA methyltransferase [Xanthomonas nasturtii]|uniref:class I SAM-dependent DNA methyltransferase n=1 Tax=Xanthomonas nasturtii TaxID=1843581 RepID=UPI0020118AAD|nr:class I SAM-dependent methyltransferase [Xanthomonas nasturtii]MCL1497890.1 class I SAM-dependent methyltransferase [Xanthomonas nasturtii]MCL1501592.1 class I SAM-dependent methyltransferase [Xanthomonas nasturtii]MCL1523062.1 class I SAM-dependent methyltransferase [Xanthomonas nasturtii]
MNAQANADYFDSIYQQPDPFGYATRWYEARKRDILLATLPKNQFARGWELGCSNGEVTRGLAARCEYLLATDMSAAAVEQAKQRVGERSNVEILQACHPQQWPVGSFDLIVLSEIGYYLGAAELDDLIVRIQDALTPDGLLLACHWKHPFEQAQLDGVAVHACIARLLTRPLAYRYEDSDFLLEAWTAQPLSVAQQEGLR